MPIIITEIRSGSVCVHHVDPATAGDCHAGLYSDPSQAVGQRKLIRQKAPFKLKEISAIRFLLQLSDPDARSCAKPPTDDFLFFEMMIGVHQPRPRRPQRPGIRFLQFGRVIGRTFPTNSGGGSAANHEGAEMAAS
jgi:hypothetical protein